MSVNGESLELSGASAARVENDRLLVPVRKVAEALGYQVSWEPYTNRVTVSEGRLSTISPSERNRPPRAT